MNLKKGDTIGIVAPSGPFEIDKFDKGISLIKEMGFKVEVPKEVYERKGYLAGSDSLRAELIESMFLRDDIDWIMCARGGYGVHRILDKIDYELIKENPKPFMGFSDITALLIALNERAMIPALHGPVVTSLSLLSKKDVAKTFEVLSMKRKEHCLLESDEPYVPNDGTASGRLVGGNLCILCHLAGTDFEPDYNGKILFIEDVNEPLYKIDRMLTHLRLSGVFDKISGLVIGEFKGCGEKKEIEKLFKEFFEHLDIPAVGGFGFGHGSRNEPVPIGKNAKLTASDATLEIWF